MRARAVVRAVTLTVVVACLAVLAAVGVVWGLTGRLPGGGAPAELAEVREATPRPEAPAGEPTQSPAPAASPADAEDASPRITRYIGIDGLSGAAGTSPDTAMPLQEISRAIAEVGPGGEVLVLARDQAVYATDREIVIEAGGAPGRPVVVRGATRDGADAIPVIAGDRANPYRPDGPPGSEVFRLLEGADHLVFRSLEFRDQGNGCFRFGANLEDITIEEIVAVNVRRFIENSPSADRDTADVTGLVVREVRVFAFSKGAIRLQGDTNNVLIEDVVGDSRWQDLDDFAIGLALQGTVHDVTVRGTTMVNALDSSGGAEGYWNGDGFTAEENTYAIRFEDTRAAGNSDGGYDLKGRDITLIRTLAEGNKRNYRLWGQNITASDCIGRGARTAGGTGEPMQVQALSSATVALYGCTFEDPDPATQFFVGEDTAQLDVNYATVLSPPSSQLVYQREQAVVTLDTRLERPALESPPP